MSNLIRQLGYLSGGSRFRRIYEKLQIDGDRIYRASGIDFKSSWFPVYFTLSRADRPLTIMEITNQIAFSHITVNNILKELAQKKLVRIDAHPADRRSKVISLTKKGTKLLDTLEPVWQQISAVLKELLTKGHPDILAILERIDDALEEASFFDRFSRFNNAKR